MCAPLVQLAPTTTYWRSEPVKAARPGRFPAPQGRTLVRLVLLGLLLQGPRETVFVQLVPHTPHGMEIKFVQRRLLLCKYATEIRILPWGLQLQRLLDRRY